MYSRKIVVFTGAGLSADSGIATYRGSETFQGVPYEEVMNSKTMAEHPELVHALCDDRRAELADASPNAAHRMIAELATAYGDRFVHITQNIDDLVERAGYGGSMHVHGRLEVMRSIGNSKVEVDIGHCRYWSGDPEAAPPGGYRFRCPKSGSLFRPGVVLFRHFLHDEPAPLYPLTYRIMGGLHPDDLLIVIGTEGSVLPVNKWARNADCRKVLNNLHDAVDIQNSSFDIYLKERAESAADKIRQIAHDHMAAA
ncbi:hypothetical protein G6L37_01425 [Agrobacterium rubi]|nr:hypothetical protein [Agrobacterium rubi]NTF24053.1 hypothetical protein [Agrobacterium rubi]